MDIVLGSMLGFYLTWLAYNLTLTRGRHRVVRVRGKHLGVRGEVGKTYSIDRGPSRGEIASTRGKDNGQFGWGWEVEERRAA